MISIISHDLPFDMSTYDSFHQLLKEVKPLAIAQKPDFGVVYGLNFLLGVVVFRVFECWDIYMEECFNA